MARRGRIPGAMALGVLFIACGARTSTDWGYGDGGTAGTGAGAPTGGLGSPSTGGSGGTGGASPTTTTGGSGGSAVADTCSLLPYRGEGACVDCIIDNCCTEYDRCADTCVGEFECVQEEVNQIYRANGTVTRAEQNEALDDCRLDADDTRIVALFNCLVSHERCSTSCLGSG